MTPVLKIATLGGLAITLDGVPVTGLASRKAEALLVYLACQPRPHSRDALADLLWDGLTTERARGNLSVLLTSLRQQLGLYLIINRHSVAFNPNQPCELDVAAFTSAANHPAELEQALALYRGDFLDGFVIRDSPRFEDWLLSEQDRLRQVAHAARHMLIARYLSEGNDAAGITHAQALLQHAAWDEDAHRALMQFFARRGQRNAALAQYEACRSALQAELGVAPSEETTTLYLHLRDEDPKALISPTLRNAPFEPTALVGRETELTHIIERLAKPACRLLSVVGPGGMGKTRLAVEAAKRYTAHAQCEGTFVPLAALNSGAMIASAIADALGITLPGQRSPNEELLMHLQDRRLLIVLDNAEHLPEAADIANDIITRAPNVKVLVTSRQPLFVQAEWLFDLQGLAYPEDATQFIDVQHLEKFSALRLFAERAGRVQAGFALDQTNVLPIIRICQRVGGLPLGIELAAAWVHVISCEQIADEIHRNYDFLATKSRDLPQRHRSVRAVFDHSWQLLDEAARQHLCSMAVFRGGFNLDAAMAVCNQPRLTLIDALTGLVDKSLLQCNRVGRYELHELVRQFALEKLDLDAPTAQMAWQRHAHYFADWLSHNESRLIGPQRSEALQAIGLEMENVRAAWVWAVDHEDVTSLSRMLHSLFLFLDISNRFQEGADLFERAVSALQQYPSQVLGQLLVRLGKLSERLGNYAQGLLCVESGLVAARQFNDTKEIAFALEAAARIADRQGDYPKARTLLVESLSLYRTVNDAWGIASVLHNLGSAAEGLQDYAEAKRLTLESLAIRRTLNDPRGMALGYNLLGIVTEMMQDYAEAVSAYEKSLALFQALNDRWGMALPMSNLGDVCDTLGDYAAAQAHYLQALRIALEIWNVPSMLTSLVKMGMLLAKTGAHKRAAELLALAIAHPATDKAFIDRACGTLAELATHLPPNVLAAAQARGEVRTLEAVVRELVGSD